MLVATGDGRPLVEIRRSWSARLPRNLPGRAVSSLKSDGGNKVRSEYSGHFVRGMEVEDSARTVVEHVFDSDEFLMADLAEIHELSWQTRTKT